jgi:hypothetical protein
MAEGYGYLSGQVPVPPFPEIVFPEPEKVKSQGVSEADILLIEQKEWITDRLKLGWKSVTVWEELPMKVSRSSFYRFLHRHGLERISERMSRIIPEIVHQPGEALILDWGKLRSCQRS